MAKKPMGMGVIGRPDVTIKRKFRWTFEIQGFCGNASNRIGESFVKVAGRPKLEIDETEFNHLNGRMYRPGKGTWQPVTVTYIDAAHDELRPLYSWLATVYNFTDPVGLSNGEARDWGATGVLTMYDGCGQMLEQWQMENVWPQNVDFGDVDYSVSDEATIELTLRYQDVRYRSFCPDYIPVACCTPCGPSSRLSA
jgi:hypothetical protein